MKPSSRRIARRILIIHTLLFCGVLALVYLATRTIYYSARDQEIQQASLRQEMLAAQASRSIQDYYSTIISDLDLARKSEGDEPATMPTHSGVAAIRERAFYPYLWNQLNGRVSALFIYDRLGKDAEHAMRLVEPRAGADAETPEALVEEMQLLATTARQWLDTARQPAISRVLPVKVGSLLRKGAPMGGVNLVSVAPFEGGRFFLVAVAPAAEIQSRFLPDIAERKNTSTTLMDDNLQVIASSSPAMVGTNLKDIDDPAIRDLMKKYAANPRRQTQPFERPMTIAGMTIEPRLITAEPVTIAGSRWSLLVSSPMAEVDAVVNRLFRSALYWAGFIVISVTAILISTASQMIRARLRLERIQHHLLAREISQARQIQLNWLPGRQNINPALDIAAINRPANHISGDFYNWFDLPDGRQVITIGDVTGHGMTAAFLMATTQLLVRTTMPRLSDPGECLGEVNRQLCSQAFRGQFVTMLVMVLDIENGVAEIATAGHHPPLISHGGEFTPLPLRSQLVLAVDENQKYVSERFELTPRSRMLLFTDGVVDVQNEAGERFNPEGLSGSISTGGADPRGMIDAIVNAVNAFRGRRELDDDLTLVAIQLQTIEEKVSPRMVGVEMVGVG